MAAFRYVCSRRPPEVQTEHQNEKKSWFKWLGMQHGCWCKSSWGYIWHTPTKIRQQKTGQTFADLMSPHFCCSVQVVKSEFLINNINAWLWWCNGFGDIYFGPLITHWSSFKCRDLLRLVGHHGFAADTSTATEWCYHVNSDQSLWGMFPAPWCLSRV